MKRSYDVRSVMVVALGAFLSGCTIGATGGTVMLSGTLPATPTPVEKIEIFLEKPTRPYKVIALINTSADTDNFLSVAHAEKAALKKLKEQASQAGADGIIEISREVLESGAVVSSTTWGSASATTHGSGNEPTGSVYGTGGEAGSLSRSYSISFRAKAIKLQ